MKKKAAVIAPIEPIGKQEKGISLDDLDELVNKNNNGQFENITPSQPPNLNQFLSHQKSNSNIKNGKKKKSSKQNTSTGKTILPPMHTTNTADFAERLSADEARLHELQRLASSQASNHIDHSEQYPGILKPSLPSHMLKPLTGTSSTGRIMTGSEAEFLSRQSTTQNHNPSTNVVPAQQINFRVSRDDDAVSRQNDQSKLYSPNSRANSANALLSYNTSQNSQINGGIHHTHHSNGNNQVSEKHSLVAMNLKFKTIQEKMQQVIDENAHWQHLLALRESELENKDAKLKSLQQEYEKCKKEAVVEAKRLQQEHDTELVRLKEQHAKERSLLLQQSQELTSMTIPSTAQRTQSSQGRQGMQQQGSNDAIVQLREEIARLQDQLLAQKKQLQQEFSQKSQLLQQQQVQEVSMIQSQCTMLEDKILQYEEREDKLRQDKLQIQQQLLLAEQAKNNAERQADKLKEDLKLMQQSVQTSYRLESHGANSLASLNNNSTISNTSGSNLLQNLPSDLETQMRLHDAQYEAKIQQLQHKLTFFKQQYETEKLSLQETQQQVSQLQNKIKKLSSEHEKKIQEVSQSMQENFHLKEQDIRENYENRMQELTILQQQLSQLSYDRQLKEDTNMRLEQQVQLLEKQVSTYQMKLEEHRTVISQLKERIGQMENDRVDDDETWEEGSVDNEGQTKSRQKKPSKLQTDALLRRLENERQYLKNQLTTEVTLKKELQQLLQDCQRQLAETNAQWTKDVSQLQEKISENTDTWEQEKSSMQQQIAALQLEKSHISGVQIDLKQSVQKFRDQIRMDSVQQQQLHQDIRNLSEKYQQSQEEIIHLEKCREDEKQYLTSKMEQMEKVFKTQQSNLLKENGMLKEELAKQLSENAHMQSTLLKNRAEQEEVEICTQKRLKSLQMVLIFGRVLQRKKMSYFRNWARQATLCSVAQNFKDNMAQILQTVQQDTKRLQQETIDKVNNQWKQKLETELASQAEQFDEKQKELEREMQLDTERKLDNLREEHEAVLQQVEGDHQFDLQRLQQQCQDLQDEHTKNIHNLREKWNEDKARDIQLLQEKWDSIQKEKTMSMELEFEKRARDADASYAKGLSAMKEDMKRQFENELAATLIRQEKALENQFSVIERQFREEKKFLEESLANLTSEKEKEMSQKWAVETEKWMKEQEKVQQEKLSSQRTQLYEEFEERLRKLRQTWHEEVFVVERLKWEEEFKIKWQDKEKHLQQQSDLDKKAFQDQLTKEFADKEQAMLTQNDLFLQEQRHQIAKECAETVETERKRFEDSFRLQEISLQEQQKVKLEEQMMEFEKAKESFIEAENLLLQGEMKRFSVEKEQEIRSLIHDEHQQDLAKQKEHYEQLLQQEKQRMEALKNDIVQKNHFFAQERSQLLVQISSFDHKFTALENLKRSEILNLQQEMQQEKELLQIKHQEVVSAMTHAHSQEKKQLEKSLTQELTETLTAESDAKIKFLQDEHDKMLQQWQQDNTALVNQLEEKLHNLKNEKNELTTKLDTISEKLESTEDALYDTEKLFKQHKQQFAWYQWQNVVRLMRLRASYQKLLEQEEENCNRRIEKVKEDAKFPVYDMGYQLYKLSLYLHTWEMQRKQIQESFTTFKATELKSLKKKIQVFAQEIDVLSIEKDHLEENFQQIEEEISVMTQQVTEQEVLMKSLSAESAISVNGRINVAFARKKRRIDAEIERLLEHIELKKTQLSDQESKIMSKQQQREEKENLLIDCERQLVSILIEQQRFLQQEVQQMGGYYEKTTFLLSVLRLFPWPPANNNTAENASSDTLAPTKYSANSIVEPTFDEIKMLMVQYKDFLHQLQLQQQQQQGLPPNIK